MQRCKEILSDAHTWLTILCVMFVAEHAQASMLGGLVAGLDTFATELIAIGVPVTILGFVWTCLAAIFGVRGGSAAIGVLVLGLAISFARPIVTAVSSLAG